MGWFGKIIGGTIGLAVGGPAGAAAGTAMGHLVDKNDLNIDDDDEFSFTLPKDNIDSFYKGIFHLFADISILEKGVSRRKLYFMENFIKLHLKSPGPERSSIVKIFNEKLNSKVKIDQYKKFFHECSLYEDIALFTLKNLVFFAYSNLHIKKETYNFLKKISYGLDIEQKRMISFQKRVVEKNNTPFAILDSLEDDDMKTITKNYRNLVSVYHPDKNPDNDTIERFLKIQSSYEYIKKIYSD